ncbi:hypothetical protein TNCV_995711 [Trichonephila clavipes]|nr:hypothetical protein TNCV_995711 [Trichonephila clavipes]
MAQHRPRKSSSVEYTTDEEDMIVYDVENEIESKDVDKFAMKECYKNNPETYLSAFSQIWLLRQNPPHSLTHATYRDCCLSYCSIASHVVRDPMTFSRMRNQWVQDSNTELHTGSQRLALTSS